MRFQQTSLASRGKGLLAMLGLFAWAGAAEARTEIVQWTHSDPSTVDEFRIYVAPGNVAFDKAGSALTDAGVPTPAAGVYEWALTVPDGDTVWVTVAAANSAGEGPHASPQLRSAPPLPQPEPSPSPTPSPTPSPSSPPIGTAPSVGSTTTSAGPGAGWTLVGTGDFDGDGRDGLLWQNGSAREIWDMDGGQVVDRAALPVLSSKWQFLGAGDFDGDGNDDILLRHRKKKKRQIWFMDGPVVLRAAALPISKRWRVRGIGDMDGDGRDDLLLRKRSKKNPKKFSYRAVSMNGEVPGAITQLGKMKKSFQPVGVGDFDGDGHADIVWQDAKYGSYQVWLIRDLSMVGGATLDTTTALRVHDVADVDGDGSDDVIWHDPAADAYWASMMSGPMEREIVYLSGSRLPSSLGPVGDLDGNGLADLIWITGGTELEVWTHQP